MVHTFCQCCQLCLVDYPTVLFGCLYNFQGKGGAGAGAPGGHPLISRFSAVHSIALALHVAGNPRPRHPENNLWAVRYPFRYISLVFSLLFPPESLRYYNRLSGT